MPVFFPCGDATGVDEAAVCLTLLYDVLFHYGSQERQEHEVRWENLFFACEVEKYN